MSDLVEKNFKVSVAVLVIGCLMSFWHLSHSMASVQAVYGGFAYRVFLAPLFALLISTVGWFAYYRNGEGNWQAFYVGFFLIASTIGLLVSAGVNELNYSKTEVAIVLYAGASHIAYGLLDWRAIFKTLSNEP